VTPIDELDRTMGHISHPPLFHPRISQLIIFPVKFLQYPANVFFSAGGEVVTNDGLNLGSMVEELQMMKSLGGTTSGTLQPGTQHRWKRLITKCNSMKIC